MTRATLTEQATELIFQAPMDATVLYVEDEEFDRFLMQRAFQKAGIESALRLVNDGAVAIQYLSGANEYADREKCPLPTLVLLDLNLPEVHGFEVLEWIRSQPQLSGLPVVIFSSSEREDDRVRAQALGANEFLKKPGSGVNFLDVVHLLKDRWLSGAQAQRPQTSTAA